MRYLRLFASPAISISLVLSLVFSSEISLSQSAHELKKNSEEYRAYMVEISRQLGVSCVACHSTKNFASDEKKEFRVAKDHMRITQTLIDAGFNGEKGQPKADCFMCHRGQIKPDYREKHDPMTMEKLRKRLNLNPLQTPKDSSPAEDE